MIKLKNPSLHSSNHTYMDLSYKISGPWNLIQKRVFLYEVRLFRKKMQIFVECDVLSSSFGQVSNL